MTAYFCPDKRICKCNPGWTGACCDTECINGEEIYLPPYGTSTCKCDNGWGGQSCTEANHLSIFFNEFNSKSPVCGSFITHHKSYSYDFSNQNLISFYLPGGYQMIEMHDPSIFVELGSFEEHNENNHHHILDDCVTCGLRENSGNLLGVDWKAGFDNDFTVVGWIANDEMDWDIFGLDAYIGIPDFYDSDSTLTGDKTVDDCRMMYKLLQRFSSFAPGTTVEIYFTAGDVRYSRMPTDQTARTEMLDDVYVFPANFLQSILSMDLLLTS
uniref:uncharacterized protein LOC120326943 n=1 Tax=Styela clava TaxID=7725 RepID=UPI00193A593D|nr:uncharacterized protein LOC120326943 [Styela clava]